MKRGGKAFYGFGIGAAFPFLVKAMVVPFGSNALSIDTNTIMGAQQALQSFSVQFTSNVIVLSYRLIYRLCSRRPGGRLHD